MAIKRETLEAAASAGMLKYTQIDNLFVFLAQQEMKRTSSDAPKSRRFSVTSLYFTVLLVASAAVSLVALTKGHFGI